jgi:hypothetical protein
VDVIPDHDDVAFVGQRPGEIPPPHSELEARVARLEAQLAFLDLLLVPRIRAAAAVAATHIVIRSDRLPAAALGFFREERAAGGVSFRWTEYDGGGRLHVPLVEGVCYMGLLTLLRSPHVSGPGDVVLTVGGQRLLLGESTSTALLALPFEHVPTTTGMAEVVVNSAALFVPERSVPGSTDARRLGVQMCSLEMMLGGHAAAAAPDDAEAPGPAPARAAAAHAGAEGHAAARGPDQAH